jgi:hypothetical protein
MVCRQDTDNHKGWGMKPPSIRELLQEESFKRMMKTIPALPDTLTWGDPWQLWGLTHAEKWRTAKFPTYADAWRKAVQMIREKDIYQDVCVVSRRVFFPPPAGFVTHEYSGEWCGRCRRPSFFWRLPESHHALRNQPALTDDEPFRCYYCGIRQVAMPRYEKRW